MKIPGQNPGPDALIYVVDDEEFIVKLTSLILRQAGLRARGFTNPQEAIEALRKESVPPALLICDFEMAPLNGVTLIQECQQYHPSLKAIMISGSGMDEAEEALARQVRMDRFLVKPVANEELVRIVQEVLANPSPSPMAWTAASTEQPRA